MKRFCISLFICLVISGCQSQVVPSEEVDNHTETEISDRQTEREVDNTEEAKETEEQEGKAETVQPESQYVINKTNWLVEPINESNDQVVLLTIDDGPEQYSVQMAETLKELNAGAIFFVNGHFLNTEEEREKLKDIYEMGFEIGNHTMTHPNMSQLSNEEQRNQIIQLNDLIEEIIGERPRFYRAPFGVNTNVSNEVIEEEGMVSMNWTYGYDWEKEYQEANALADIMVNTSLLTKGANLLMHDRKWTAEALEEIVIGLRAKGYEVVNPSSIITEHEGATN
ncbi:polysaccharide deacetylase family protein [Halalkalibacter kiskunsagensis]|uniref:Polysaccharide deacetylase family protein n=1 Tax=Halalkalibacter kiskunsagensis TaxID=1548599 RepID=A0ABV6KC99_9BACI